LPPARSGGTRLEIEALARVPRLAAETWQVVRAHVEGEFIQGQTRWWAGPPVPEFIPLQRGDQELMLLDPVAPSGGPGGYFAVYRELASGDNQCSPLTNHRCQVTAAFFTIQGELAWVAPLARYLEEDVSLGVQDIRSDGKQIYFSEYCFRHDGRGLRGECGQIVALDPVAGKVLWRSRSRVAAREFLMLEDLLVTAWPDPDSCDVQCFLLRRSDGQIAGEPTRLSTGNDRMFALTQREVMVIEGINGDDFALQISRLAVSASEQGIPRLREVSTQIFERNRHNDCSGLPDIFPPLFPEIPGCSAGLSLPAP
jgi:hypothetical protein